MHIHLLGICGTFMGGLALMARDLGHQVTGSDHNVYPPMSTLLKQQGIQLYDGYDPANLDPRPDLVIIGNALSRGNPEVEAVLNLGLPYTSGARWLYEAVLKDRWVLAVAGTHGKTTPSSMLAWILEDADLEPGFLIGGIPLNFGVSARLGRPPYFVIEADEYDTAFFDKRSKFLHYRPRTAILNNLEYDHADIFPDLPSIQRQFHHLVRTIPGNGLIVAPAQDAHLGETLRMGCWTRVVHTAVDDEAPQAPWRARLLAADGSTFQVWHEDRHEGSVQWTLSGRHNVRNALAAIAAAAHVGVPPTRACASLTRFRHVKRRLETFATIDGITLYDDFAHHPTAIATTLEGLRAKIGAQRIIAVLEPRSNSMRLGVHADTLGASLRTADYAIVYQAPDLSWDIARALTGLPGVSVYTTLDDIVDYLRREARSGDHLVFMSNGSFSGLHGRVADALRARAAPVS